MQKKMLAVAVAGALGAPAIGLAQSTAPATSTVQIFGTIYVEMDLYNNKTHSTSAAPFPDRVNFDYMRTAGSEIGVKGEEQLGGGLSAWFQCSQSADVRGVTPGNGWCTRNSALGIKGGFGNLYAGKWDTPYKRAYSIGNVAGGESGGFGTAVLLNNGSTEPAQTPTGVAATTLSATRGIYARREVNILNYDSPSFAGFQVIAAAQLANASTNITSGNTNTKPRTLSIAGTYSGGPLGAAIFYEKHKDQGLSATGPGSGAAGTIEMDDYSWGLSAAYTWGPVKFGGVWKRENYDVPNSAAVAAGTGDQRLTAWHAGVDWTIVGAHGVRAAYTYAGRIKGQCVSAACPQAGPGIGVAVTAAGYRPGMGFRPDVQSGTSAAMWQIRYVYAFSKRTEFNFGFSKINNSSNAGYNFSDITGGGTPVAPGRDPSGWVTSLQHKF